MSVIHPVILSGGSGVRLWPLSRSLYPKQLLALHSSRTMLQETVLRIGGDAFATPLIICNDDHRFIIADQLREIGAEGARIVLEPVGRNTAPAAAVAALLLEAQEPGAMMMLAPSDHVIADVPSFHAAVAMGAAAAGTGALVTFGVVAARPETGYGYIHRGAPVDGAEGCFRIDRFVEKPDRATAAAYVESGDTDWNSGIFLMDAGAFLAELERLNPELLACCREAVAGASEDLGFLRLDATGFERVESISIDHAVMERTDKAVVVPVDMGWNDVGAWPALWEISDKDDDGNVSVGDVLIEDSRNSYVRSDGRLVVGIGLDDMVVVATDDAVLVAPKDAAQSVRDAVAQMKEAGRPEPAQHTRVYRPWGYYQTIDAGEGFQVKHISVNPGAKLSLQMHHHRAEHWVVVSGTARVRRGDETITLSENESTYIPIGVTHSLENLGTVPLRLIEVQSGAYLGEDDIVRFEDLYGRAEAEKG